MLGFNHILTIVLLSKADACPYLQQLRGDSNAGDSSAKAGIKRMLNGHQSTFFYGRFFGEGDASTFTTPAYNLIEASRPDESFMDRSSREVRPLTGGVFLKFPNGTTTDIKLGGIDAAGLAGHTYLGQLLSHDMNLDLTSQLGVQIDPSTLPNTVSPLIDLDTIYGIESVDIEPNLSDGKFVIGMSESGKLIDFPREDGMPKIVDPRNDDNKILAQITVVFMKLHNKLFDEYVSGHGNGNGNGNIQSKAFDYAKEETQRNWQSVVKYELLPELLDNDVLDEIVSSSYQNVLYQGDIEQVNGMPVEFSTAAYRLFHARLANAYRLQAGGDRLGLFPSGSANEPSLAGGQKLPAGEMIDFNCFFNETEACAQGAHIIDMLYVSTLLKMSIGEPGTPLSTIVINDDSIKYTLDGPAFQLDDGTVTADLATLDLTRAQTHRVPGGIALAEHAKSLGADIGVLSIEDMLNSPFGLPTEYYDTKNLPEDVPLLVYLAHESLSEHQGRRQGKLGSLICGETILTLIEKTNSNPGVNWVSSINDSAEISFLDIVDFVGWDWENDQPE